MKRIICLVLVLVMVLGLCACGGKSKEYTGLKVGFAREKIMPETVCKLGGGDATNRISEGYLDFIYVTCIAITSGEETILMYTSDLCNGTNNYTKPAVEAASKASGIPIERIFMHTTHTHSAPEIRGTSPWDGLEAYRQLYYTAVAKVATDAIADQSPAELYYGNTMTENMAGVRHYELDNGTFAGNGHGDFKSGNVVAYAWEPDTEMQLIKFARAAEDKKDIVLVNFPAHATFNGSEEQKSISADYPGPFRDYIEANSDSLAAFFIAAAGDQVRASRIKGAEAPEDYREYGQKLGEYAISIMDNLTKSEDTTLKVNAHTYTATSNKDGLERLEDAKKVNSVIKTYGGKSHQARAALEQYGFHSYLLVTNIVARSESDPTVDVPLNVTAIGDVSLVHAPYEMFGATGRYIKDNSPYAMSFIATCGRGSYGYMPTPRAFELEIYESYVTRFEPGTAEKLADEFVGMLKKMKGA